MMRQSIVFFGCAAKGVFAEIFALSNVAIPDSQTSTVHYIFHVYATAVGGPQVNPGASVRFKDLEVKWSNGEIGRHKSLHVSLIPRSAFWNLANTGTFCSAERTMILKGEAGVPVFALGEAREATFPITATDAYFLAVTNCGERSGATFTKGEVIVNQPHGYLPGNKLWTMVWLGWFTLINALLCIMWFSFAAYHYKALVYIQKMIAACAMTAMLEAAIAYFEYKGWNETGNQDMMSMAATICAYSLKCSLTLRMLFDTSVGSGVIMERLEMRAETKMEVVCAVFLVEQWAWKAIMAHKYCLMISPTFLLAITIPGSLLWLALFCWVWRKFQTLLSQLQDRKLASEAVNVFINMQFILVASCLLATLALLIQLTDIVLPVTPWNIQWVPYDAAPHVVYTLFLLALMILWWPRADSFKFRFFNEVKQSEDETDDGGKVHAEQIGLTHAEKL